MADCDEEEFNLPLVIGLVRVMRCKRSVLIYIEQSVGGLVVIIVRLTRRSEAGLPQETDHHALLLLSRWKHEAGPFSLRLSLRLVLTFSVQIQQMLLGVRTDAALG